MRRIAGLFVMVSATCVSALLARPTLKKSRSAFYGRQIYSCNLSAGSYSWGLVAPRADLYGDNGKLIATHFGGPTWQATDGSYVIAKRIDGVVMDSSAIAWLKLQATSTSLDGRLAGTTFIQRVATTGGVAPPAAECSAGTVGTIQEIPYTADYYFWKRTG